MYKKTTVVLTKLPSVIYIKIATSMKNICKKGSLSRILETFSIPQISSPADLLLLTYRYMMLQCHHKSINLSSHEITTLTVF